MTSWRAIPPIRGKWGQPRQRPQEVHADRGYGLDTRRWVVEQTIALLRWFGRPRIRWEIRDDIHEAFLVLGRALTCRRRLMNHRL